MNQTELKLNNDVIESVADSILSADVGIEDQSTGEVSLVDLFDGNVEAAQEFFEGLPAHMLKLWSMNDKLVAIGVRTGYGDAMRNFVASLDITQERGPQAQGVLDTLKGSVDIAEEDETDIRLVTMRDLVGVSELISAHNWASLPDPETNIYENLRKKRYLIHPTMQEIRMLMLVDTLLDIREKENSRKVTVASRVNPQTLRK